MTQIKTFLNSRSDISFLVTEIQYFCTTDQFFLVDFVVADQLTGAEGALNVE